MAWLIEPTRAVAKMSLHRVIITVYEPNVGHLSMTRMKLGENKWRFELTDAEELADELWLGVKCHSNPDNSGSSRNTLRRSN